MRRAGNSAGFGRDREKHNVTEAMVQIRERSRRARRTGSDEHCKSSGVQRAIKTKQQAQQCWQSACLQERRTARDPQEHAGCERSRSQGHQGRENSLNIASLTRQSAQSDSSSTTASAAREKETQDSSKSEADYLNDTLKRANLTSAVLMDDVDTNQRVISVLRTR